MKGREGRGKGGGDGGRLWHISHSPHVESGPLAPRQVVAKVSIQRLVVPLNAPQGGEKKIKSRMCLV